MNLTYTMQGDYLIPDLVAPESPNIGKFGMLRRTFLREHKNGIYTGMMLNGTLDRHLEEIDRQASRMLDTLMERLKAQNGVTEKLKAADQMEWVRRMNIVREQATEIVNKELIIV